MRIILMLLAAAGFGLAQPIDWSDTPEALAGQSVSVTLTDGTTMSGTWVSVTPNTFTMKVDRTTNRRAFGGCRGR
jgi:hypothetical protein